MSQQAATILGASITGSIALTVGVLAYIFGRLQKEHEVQFTRLYESRAEIIASLFTLLQDLLNRFTNWRDFHEQDRKDARDGENQPIRDTLDGFYEVLRRKEVWMSKGTSERLHEFYKEVDEKWYSAALPADQGRAQEIAESVQGWVEQSLPNLIDDLKSEFRETLGIRDESEGRIFLSVGWRIAVGWLGSAFIGLGLASLFVGLLRDDLPQALNQWWFHPLCGLAVGLGFGMLLEYIRPSRLR